MKKLWNWARVEKEHGNNRGIGQPDKHYKKIKVIQKETQIINL